jgi:hypothetical protein
LSMGGRSLGLYSILRYLFNIIYQICSVMSDSDDSLSIIDSDAVIEGYYIFTYLLHLFLVSVETGTLETENHTLKLTSLLLANLSKHSISIWNKDSDVSSDYSDSSEESEQSVIINSNID